MDRRRQSRLSIELPVQISGTDAHGHPFAQSARVCSISGRGATLQGVTAKLKTGDLVDLQYKGNKAQFRIVWLGQSTTEKQGEVGVENLSQDVLLWDIDPLRCTAAVGRG